MQVGMAFVQGVDAIECFQSVEQCARAVKGVAGVGRDAAFYGHTRYVPDRSKLPEASHLAPVRVFTSESVLIVTRHFKLFTVGGPTGLIHCPFTVSLCTGR